ncbi:hypothetical protein B0H63DRAFT_532081 [Podospora didyma]|uniref:C2H2-type domain-containing protein n=1 Tax=Podospora didyma TaxID=330526 RepID=A0AAE0U874_9PEZI|nr:hypothetical protein B0H63DRAFT_532081 [Podospora didyma]
MVWFPKTWNPNPLLREMSIALSQASASSSASQRPGGYYSSQPMPQGDDVSFRIQHHLNSRQQVIIKQVAKKVAEQLRKAFTLRHQAAQQKQTATGGLKSPLCTSSSRAPSEASGKDWDAETIEVDTEDDDADVDSGDSVKPPVNHGEGKTARPMGYPFACPYLKYKPDKYKNCGECAGPGWFEIDQLKEHLYQVHRKPTYQCRRCWRPFEECQYDEFLEHRERERENENACPPRLPEPPEGFIPEQEERLRDPTRTANMSAIQQWKILFITLFPHMMKQEIPLPFSDYVGTSPASAGGNMPTRNDRANTTTAAAALTECEEYIIREAQLRIQKLLEQSLAHDQNLTEQNAVAVVNQCVANLIAEATRRYQTAVTQHATITPATSESSRLQTPQTSPKTGFNQDSTAPASEASQTQPPQPPPEAHPYGIQATTQQAETAVSESSQPQLSHGGSDSGLDNPYDAQHVAFLPQQAGSEPWLAGDPYAMNMEVGSNMSISLNMDGVDSRFFTSYGAGGLAGNLPTGCPMHYPGGVPDYVASFFPPPSPQAMVDAGLLRNAYGMMHMGAGTMGHHYGPEGLPKSPMQYSSGVGVHSDAGWRTSGSGYGMVGPQSPPQYSGDIAQAIITMSVADSNRTLGLSIQVPVNVVMQVKETHV